MVESNVAHVIVYMSKDGWRWRAQAGNNEIVAQGESHTRKEDAERAAASVFPGVLVEWEPVEPTDVESAENDERAENGEGTDAA